MVTVRSPVFWTVICSLVEVYQHFRGMCWPRPKGRKVNNPENGGGMPFQNISKFLPDYTVSHRSR
jgi:hypothetical protein